MYDADDALQDAELRAWEALKRFEGRSSLRSWLYTIATNTCLTQIQRRPKRVLPVDYGPATDPFAGPGEPITETVWIEPYPDTELEDGLAGPEARYEQRESVELAFIAALQHLPRHPARGPDPARGPRLLGQGGRGERSRRPSPASTARCSAPAPRSRSASPEQSQQQTLRDARRRRARGDRQGLRRRLGAQRRRGRGRPAHRGRGDQHAAAGELVRPARRSSSEFLRRHPMSGQIRWKMAITTANGQPAFGAYAWDQAEEAYLAFALNVLTFRGDKISDVVAFAVKRDRRAARGGLPPLGHGRDRRDPAPEHVRAFRIA